MIKRPETAIATSPSAPDNNAFATRTQDCARGLIHAFGREAECEAYRMARKFAARKDVEGETLWLAVAKCVECSRPAAMSVRPVSISATIPNAA